MLKLMLALFLVSAPAFADVSVPRSKQYAAAVYDVSLAGGASVPHNLGLRLPAGALVTDVWVYINTAFTDSGAGSLGLQCAGTNDLMAYQDVTAIAKDGVIGRHLQPVISGAIGSSFVPLNASNAATVMSFENGSIPSDCAVTAVVRGDSGFVPLTAGKATFILEYFKLF